MRTIGILGPYSSRNFGDTAIQMAVIDGLRRLDPHARFIGICPDPPDTVRVHDIAAFPLSGEYRHVLKPGEADLPPGAASASTREPGRLRRLIRALANARNILRCVGQIDMLVISGSGQLDDYWGGPWRHPYALYLWTLACRLRGIPVAVLGIGLDDLSTSLGRWFALRSVRRALYCAVRDTGTQQFLEKHHAGGLSHVCPDPAFALRRYRQPDARGSVQGDTVLVCLISRRAWLRSTTEAYERYRRVMREVCLRLLQAGRAVRLSNSQTNLDGPLVQEFAAELRAAAGVHARIETAEACSVEQYIHAAAAADLVIASRLHALILALVAGTPVVAVSYGRKVRQLMTELQMAEQCLDLVGLEPEPLLALVGQELQRRSEAAARVSTCVAGLASTLSEEFEAVLRL